ncbi:hypothetical protein HK104_000780 [Borealophlyctis nickersoniae]|nr:hypothetical protein HK104_000780 [Borealophlyctis nickersoniae]
MQVHRMATSHLLFGIFLEPDSVQRANRLCQNRQETPKPARIPSLLELASVALFDTHPNGIRRLREWGQDRLADFVESGCLDGYELDVWTGGGESLRSLLFGKGPSSGEREGRGAREDDEVTSEDSGVTSENDGGGIEDAEDNREDDEDNIENDGSDGSASSPNVGGMMERHFRTLQSLDFIDNHILDNCLGEAVKTASNSVLTFRSSTPYDEAQPPAYFLALTRTANHWARFVGAGRFGGNYGILPIDPSRFHVTPAEKYGFRRVCERLGFIPREIEEHVEAMRCQEAYNRWKRSDAFMLSPTPYDGPRFRPSDRWGGPIVPNWVLFVEDLGSNNSLW